MDEMLSAVISIYGLLLVVTVHESLCKWGLRNSVKRTFIVSCNGFKLKSRLKCYRNYKKYFVVVITFYEGFVVIYYLFITYNFHKIIWINS